MLIHTFQHVPFEGLGSVKQWAASRNHHTSATRFYEGERPPDLSGIDRLIILGGPMGVDDEKKYPWLIEERSFIRNAINHGLSVIGICLGAQLIASALGARVSQCKHTEIGWFPVTLTPPATTITLFEGFTERITAFHWHGDTFELPAGAVHLAESGACKNQAFLYGDRVLGLQFHIESTRATITELIENCRNEIHNVSLKKRPYVQTETEMLAVGESQFQSMNSKMDILLDRLPK